MRVRTLLSTLPLLLLPGLPATSSASAAPATPTSTAAASTMTNGCAHSARGVPSCGTLAGAAYGANDWPGAWEREQLGAKLGVRRTFWGPGAVRNAMRHAAADVSHGRLPWLSFKPPYSWGEMANGRGDAWARDLAARVKEIPGPVWVAVQHEPERQGDMLQWKRMQERLAPIMRAGAPNLGYTAILMGYHQFEGTDPQFALSRTWPDTKIDVAGFDIYELYGERKAGKPMTTRWKDLRTYFAKAQAWARSEGVAWGLAETGYSDPAAAARPEWVPQAYQLVREHGGVAFSYFNTWLNSPDANWQLNSSRKLAGFTRTVRDAPRL